MGLITVDNSICQMCKCRNWRCNINMFKLRWNQWNSSHGGWGKARPINKAENKTKQKTWDKTYKKTKTKQEVKRSEAKRNKTKQNHILYCKWYSFKCRQFFFLQWSELHRKNCIEKISFDISIIAPFFVMWKNVGMTLLVEIIRKWHNF